MYEAVLWRQRRPWTCVNKCTQLKDRQENTVNREEYELTTIGDWDTSLSFELHEAVSLIHQEVITIQDYNKLMGKKPLISQIGIVCGVLTMNSEIEVLVRFPENLEQLCKTEFCGDYILTDKACKQGS